MCSDGEHASECIILTSDEREDWSAAGDSILPFFARQTSVIWSGDTLLWVPADLIQFSFRPVTTTFSFTVIVPRPNRYLNYLSDTTVATINSYRSPRIYAWLICLQEVRTRMCRSTSNDTFN